MMGVLVSRDIEEIEEFLNFWWENYGEEFDSPRLEVIESLWAFLKDLKHLQSSMDTEDKIIFTQTWGDEFSDLETWYSDTFELPFYQLDEELEAILQFIWNKQYSKSSIH